MGVVGILLQLMGSQDTVVAVIVVLRLLGGSSFVTFCVKVYVSFFSFPYKLTKASQESLLQLLASLLITQNTLLPILRIFIVIQKAFG